MKTVGLSERKLCGGPCSPRRECPDRPPAAVDPSSRPRAHQVDQGKDVQTQGDANPQRHQPIGDGHAPRQRHRRQGLEGRRPVPRTGQGPGRTATGSAADPQPARRHGGSPRCCGRKPPRGWSTGPSTATTWDDPASVDGDDVGHSCPSEDRETVAFLTLASTASIRANSSSGKIPPRAQQADDSLRRRAVERTC